jgi:hypothetical protein
LHDKTRTARQRKSPRWREPEQLEVIYGHPAEVMLSMPSNKIVMKTSDPSDTEWASELIG